MNIIKCIKITKSITDKFLCTQSIVPLLASSGEKAILCEVFAYTK